MEDGAVWAADRINERGGLNIGGDTYMIKAVRCDTKASGSEAANCAVRFAHDEKVAFIVGPILLLHSIGYLYVGLVSVVHAARARRGLS